MSLMLLLRLRFINEISSPISVPVVEFDDGILFTVVVTAVVSVGRFIVDVVVFSLSGVVPGEDVVETVAVVVVVVVA
jgi:hypothetical protein